MVDICPAPNVTIEPRAKWDKDEEEIGFVVNAFVVSDILFIISVTVLYFYCVTRSKKKQKHLQPSVTVSNNEIVRSTENKYSIISFRRSSCPTLFT